MKNSLVSVIVPTYNEEKNIDKCLKSIVSQSYKKIEIIVVDSARSSDDTYSKSTKFTKMAFKFGSERSAQRNFGAQRSRGKYLFFVDADMTLSRDVIQECVESYSKNENIVALIIPEKSFGESYWAKCKALERNCYIGDDEIEAPRFFSKEMFLKVGGFNEDMVSGEDWDLRNRIRSLGKIDRIKNLINHNEGKLGLVNDLRKKIYYSKKSGDYINRNVKGPVNVVKFIFRPAYFRNWKLFLFDPVHAIGFVILKSLELILGAMVILRHRNFWKKMTILND